MAISATYYQPLNIYNNPVYFFSEDMKASNMGLPVQERFEIEFEEVVTHDPGLRKVFADEELVAPSR